MRGGVRMKCEDKVYSPQEYLERVTGKCYAVLGDNDAVEIGRITRTLGLDLWDYRLGDLDQIVQNEINVVLVECLYWDGNEYQKEYRWFELPEEE